MAAIMRPPTPVTRFMGYDEQSRQRSNTKSPISGENDVGNGEVHEPKTDADAEKPEETTTAEPEKVKIWGTTRQKLTLVCLSIVYFATCASFSVLSPFFPKEVREI